MGLLFDIMRGTLFIYRQNPQYSQQLTLSEIFSATVSDHKKDLRRYNRNRRCGALNWIRTNGLSLRRRPLYPTEL